MKVKELIEILQKCNPELDVVLQKDSEGNGYDKMHSWEADLMYRDGEVYDKEYCDEYDIPLRPNCVVLAP